MYSEKYTDFDEKLRRRARYIVKQFRKEIAETLLLKERVIERNEALTAKKDELVSFLLFSLSLSLNCSIDFWGLGEHHNLFV